MRRLLQIPSYAAAPNALGLLVPRANKTDKIV